MKRSMTLLSLLILSGAAFGQQAYSAKSLFFGEEGDVVAASTAGKPAVKPALAKVAVKKTIALKQIGASYFVRLKRADGTVEDVLASRSFRSGDRFQLGVKVNRPIYVYVMNQDPSGNLTQIFPVNGQDNYVNAMGTVFLPSKGAFEFDAQPGVEQLLVFLSPKPMANMTEQMRSAEPDMVTGAADPVQASLCTAPHPLAVAGNPTDDMRLASNDTGNAYAAKGIAFKDDAPADCATTQPAYAAKGIVFSDDAAPAKGGQVATYVVKKSNAASDKNLFLKLKLNHQ
jgi:hypothetical protein